MRMIKVAFIDYLVWIEATKFLGCFVPSIVIVKITMNIIVLTDNRTSFVYVAYRVQYNAVVFLCIANTFYPLFLQCHIGQEIEEAFKDATLIGYIALYRMYYGNILASFTPLEERITYFHSTRTVEKGDSVIRSTSHLIVYFPTISFGYFNVNPSASYIIQQRRM